MTNRAKQKGTSFETLVLGAVREYQPLAERRAQQGALDKGDLYLPGETRFAVECKNVKATSLGAWVDEAQTEATNAGVPVGIVVHKRRGKGQAGDQFVTLPLAGFLHLMYGQEAVPGE